VLIRALRHPGDGGGGEGGEGASKGKTQEGGGGGAGTQEKVRTMTPEEFLAANPEFKQRLEVGDAAAAAKKKADEDRAREQGEIDKLLKAEQDEHGKTKTKADQIADENKKLKRSLEIRDYLDTAKDLKYPIPAIKEFAATLDDGKMKPEELVKAAVANMEALGLAPGGKGAMTDGLGGGGSGSGGGSGQGADTDTKVAELISLGAKARITGRPQDSRAFNKLREKLKVDNVKLPADLAQRIVAAAEKKAA